MKAAVVLVLFLAFVIARRDLAIFRWLRFLRPWRADGRGPAAMNWGSLVVLVALIAAAIWGLGFLSHAPDVMSPRREPTAIAPGSDTRNDRSHHDPTERPR